MPNRRIHDNADSRDIRKIPYGRTIAPKSRNNRKKSQCPLALKKDSKQSLSIASINPYNFSNCWCSSVGRATHS